MTPLSYTDLLHRLFPRLTGGIRWGLDRTRRLLAAVGDPHLAYPVLHVGGTNGKGSVAAYLESCLREQGHRTGLYTSPHLCTFRERVRLDGRVVSETELVAAAEILWPELEAESPSFFEATTALALLVLARAEVDVAVVEVGLGGRLDATNVVEPQAVVITNVALDHTEYLGDRVESVAREKAGILKRGVHALTAAEDPVALEILETRAREVGAPLRVVGADDIRKLRIESGGASFAMPTTVWGGLDLRTPLHGAHQALNAALAVRTLEVLPPELRPEKEAVRRGIAGAEWRGRLQVEPREDGTWIFDVAHNPDAVATLARALKVLSPPRPLTAVVGILADKDWSAMLGQLAGCADALVLTVPPGAPAERRWDPRAAAEAAPVGRIEIVEEIAAALRRGRELAGQGTVLVTGSFYTVGAALALLDLAPDGVDPPIAQPDLPPHAREG